MDKRQTVFVVDDDESGRASVCGLMRSHGIAVQPFASAEEFLDFYTTDLPGCVVTDLRLTGRNGVELQEELLARDLRIPVIVLTGFARTPVTVRAMRNGAVTMLDKPFHADDLWLAIRQALAIDGDRRAKRELQSQIRDRLDQLTHSENQVLQMVIDGIPNKTIALRLDISERTVESRRHEIFAKMRADSVAELVRMVMEVREGQVPAQTPAGLSGR